MSMLHRWFLSLPLTRVKLWIAAILYCFIRPFVGKKRKRLTRHGITYEVSLDESIGLSLFLFGGYQTWVSHPKGFPIKPDMVIFDVGANIGSMTLAYAQQVPRGHVYAFEPTRPVFDELVQNVALNPTLQSRVTCVNGFVSSHEGATDTRQAYSSWRVSPAALLEKKKHRYHGGEAFDATKVPTYTIDDYCRDLKLTRVDLLKVDTDGHEFRVFEGAQETLRRWRPAFLFEIGLYEIDEQKRTIDDFYDFFHTRGYFWTNAKNGHRVTLDNYLSEIPRYATTDILARPLS